MSKEIDLHQTTDASEWAREFKRLFPDSDESLMLTWFANAIMVGYDAVKKTDGAIQTFFCIKRDEEPRYWDGEYWQEAPFMYEMSILAKHALMATVGTGAKARIVKVMVSEVEG